MKFFFGSGSATMLGRSFFPSLWNPADSDSRLKMLSSSASKALVMVVKKSELGKSGSSQKKDWLRAAPAPQRWLILTYLQYCGLWVPERLTFLLLWLKKDIFMFHCWFLKRSRLNLVILTVDIHQPYSNFFSLKIYLKCCARKLLNFPLKSWSYG